MEKSSSLRLVTPVVASVVSLSSVICQVCHGQTGRVQAEAPRFRLIRSVSGSKGSSQGNRFSMEDPRSVFYVPAAGHCVYGMGRAHWKASSGGIPEKPGRKDSAKSPWARASKEQRDAMR